MKKYLIVGLGNPGADYEFTRHNVGFKALDYFAESQSAPFEAARFGKLATTSIKGRKMFLLKPDTYMNLSGKAVVFWQKQENIPLENTLIITDDLNLDFGVLRLKAKGSAGGHNGLQNIQDILQAQAYPRLRVGIGNRFSRGRQVDYV
ncbi:MAG: aminoacyl-tRNA hydrolase, partial [Flavobacteriaceae bacterium]|nr:aminoacyl-tRNA hydrolase [Flavobacteriaceae bacterium]